MLTSTDFIRRRVERLPNQLSLWVWMIVSAAFFTGAASNRGLAADYDNFFIGLDFVTETIPSDASFFGDFAPYPLLEPTTNFVSQGGVGDLSEFELQREIVMAVEDAFRAIDALDENATVRIAIVHGALPTDLDGRRLNLAMAQSTLGISLLGQAKAGAYNSDFAQDGYAGVSYLDDIDAMGNNGTFVVYDTLDKVVNGITGTTAHEIGHIFINGSHTSTTPDADPQPIMATGSTGLPTSSRFEVRQFTDSNASIIRTRAGTTVLGDFNFDDSVDAADAGIMFTAWGMEDRLFHEGDANNDHILDAADAGITFANWTGDSMPGLSGGEVTLDYDESTSQLSLSATDVLNWYIDDGHFALPSDIVSDSLYNTDNESRIGQTSLVPFSISRINLGSVSAAELADVRVLYNTSLGAPLEVISFQSVPEPSISLVWLATLLLCQHQYAAKERGQKGFLA